MILFTTTRPLSNADRLRIWKDKISPPQGQPRCFEPDSVILETLGFVLMIGWLVMLVVLAGVFMETGL